MTQMAEDRLLMMDAIARYCWGYDEGDFDLLKQAFTPEATSAGVCTGTDVSWGPMTGPEEIASVLEDIRNGQTDQRRHNVTTFLFLSQSDTRATACFYLDCNATEGDVSRVAVAGRYEADFVKDGEIWRMSRLDATLDKAF